MFLRKSLDNWTKSVAVHVRKVDILPHHYPIEQLRLDHTYPTIDVVLRQTTCGRLEELIRMVPDTGCFLRKNRVE